MHNLYNLLSFATNCTGARRGRVGCRGVGGLAIATTRPEKGAIDNTSQKSVVKYYPGTPFN